MNFIKKYILEIGFCTLFFLAAAILNLQFLEGANVNFTFSGHDEYLTVSEVYAILNPPSIKHFFMAVISGNVLYYGKLMFYTDALIAALPYKIWGITGLVYSIRLTHVLFICLGTAALSGKFINGIYAKVLFLVGIFSMYYTAYFVMIPKPEPLQLFVIACFLIFASRRNWKFGPHFVLLGLAYGLKFNVLTILPLFFLLPFLIGQKGVKQMFISVGFFIAGILIAVPCLLLSPVKPVFLQSYLHSTFGNTGHPDDTGVPLMTWFTKWSTVYSGGLFFGIIIMLIIAYIFILSTRQFVRTRKFESHFVLILVGAGLLLPVMLFTKRLWPHYLWSGNLFLLLGTVVFFQSEFLSSKVRIAFTVLVTLVFTGIIINSLQSGSKLYSLEKDKMQFIADGKAAYSYLSSKSEKFTSVQDLSVFYPFREFVKVQRYHPFASEYPFVDPERKHEWAHYINSKTLKNANANYLLVHRRDFETESRSVSTKNEQILSQDNNSLREQIGKAIIRDTIIGSVKIYRVDHTKL